MDYYTTSLDHILAELERIDLLIQLRVWQLRQIQTIDEQFQGLYISDQQVDDLLSQPIGQPHWATAPNFPASIEIKSALSKLDVFIKKRKEQSLKCGVCLRLEKVAQLFQLTTVDIDIILICLAIELDLRYEQFYAYLQDDVNKKHPSIDLVLNLLSSTIEEKIALRQRFSSSSPLLKHHLLQIFNPSLPHKPLLSQFIQLNQRIVNYLLNCDDLDNQLLPYTQYIIPQTTWNDLIISDELKTHLYQLSKLPTLLQTGFIFYFQGNSGIGKRKTAEAICHQLGLSLLVVEGKLLRNQENIESVVHLLCREALLQNAAIYWDNFDVSIPEDKYLFQNTLLNNFISCPLPIFVAGEQEFKITTTQEKPCILVKFTNPSAGERLELWQTFISGKSVQISDAELAELVSKFRLSGEQIQKAIATAHNLALWRNPENPQITVADCYTACRMQSNQYLGTLARKITPHYRWDDIVLATEPLQQLQEICAYVKHRAMVYDQWGFDRKLALGKGLSVLFSGSSGTGKTMAADIMAGELGLELYKIDLSAVVSKYIGETEKNLAQIFSEAETSNAILFFDEADALFGKRSEVKDARDRYANIETSYLLQRMEEYEGVVILATNLRKNMDDAFVRRLHFIIDFPFPNERYRRQIWEKIFPAATPLSTDLNLNYLATRFELSGGNIRNIALAAAFLAAEDEAVVKKIHLIRAIKRECQKMGRLITEKEFEEYLGKS